MKATSEKENCGYDLDENDTLSLLRAFSQGSGLAMHSFGSVGDKEQEASLVTYVLLENSLVYSKGAADGSLGIMKCLDFFTNYWVLAYRLRGLSYKSFGEFHTIPHDELKIGEHHMKVHYDKLLNFLQQDTKKYCEIR